MGIEIALLFQAEDGIRDLVRSRGLGDVYKRQEYNRSTNPSGGGMWRKNRRNNGDGTYGVDLNRNFGFAWGYDNLGSSPTPGSETYRGPSAFSEPESQAVRDLALLKNYKTHFNLHSYQNAFLYPWGSVSYTHLTLPTSDLV